MPEETITCPRPGCDYGYGVSEIEDMGILQEDGSWKDQCPWCGITFFIMEKMVPVFTTTIWEGGKTDGMVSTGKKEGEPSCPNK